MSDNPDEGAKQYPVTLYRTSIPEAAVRADLESTYNDLQYAKAFIQEAQKPQADIIRTALFNAAHISYRRAFNRKTRGLLRSDLASLTPEELETHQYHYLQGDKLVAHSANAFEMNVPLAMVANNTFIGTYLFGVRYVGEPPEISTKWLALIDLIDRNILQPKMEAGTQALNEALKKMALSQIARGGIFQMEGPAMKDAGTSRRDFDGQQ